MSGASDIARIEAFIRKYMRILGTSGPLPRVVLKSNLGSTWLGRHTYFPKAGDSLIEVQREALVDDPTLERIVAHETVHHAEALELSASDRALLKLGARLPGHGEEFRSRAAKINAVMGAGFVTVESDKSYKKAASTKEFFILILPISGSRLGYAWTVRPSPELLTYIEKKKAEGARLVATRDERFVRGAKLKRLGPFSVPADAETQAKLAALYSGG